MGIIDVSNRRQDKSYEAEDRVNDIEPRKREVEVECNDAARRRGNMKPLLDLTGTGHHRLVYTYVVLYHRVIVVSSPCCVLVVPNLVGLP